ncbi:hypothetical protein ABT329_35475, partial [Streptomyces minutiscleroticus]
MRRRAPRAGPGADPGREGGCEDECGPGRGREKGRVRAYEGPRVWTLALEDARADHYSRPELLLGDDELG